MAEVNMLTLPYAGAVDAKKKLLPFVGKDETRPALAGVGVQTLSDGCRVAVALDGHRLRMMPLAALGGSRSLPLPGRVGDVYTVAPLRGAVLPGMAKALPANGCDPPRVEAVIPTRHAVALRVRRSAFQEAVAVARRGSDAAVREEIAAWKAEHAAARKAATEAKATHAAALEAERAKRTSKLSAWKAEVARARELGAAPPPRPTFPRLPAAPRPAEEAPRPAARVVVCLVVQGDDVTLLGARRSRLFEGVTLPSEHATVEERPIAPLGERDELRVYLNVRYLEEALASFDDEALVVELGGERDPVVLRPGTPEAARWDLAIVMPTDETREVLTRREASPEASPTRAESTLASHPLAPWDAFAANFSALRAGKILAGFRRPIRMGSLVADLQAHLLRLHHEGVRVREIPRAPGVTAEPRAWRPDERSCWSEKDLTKTGFAFLRWLETAVPSPLP